MNEKRNIIIIALVVSVVLMLAKFSAYFITSSNFVLTDAAESIVNVVASSFALFSIYIASQPRDENHPYGHGKIEFFSVFLEGALISIAGIGILFKAAYSLINPQPVHDLLIGAIIIGVTGAINIHLGIFLVSYTEATSRTPVLGRPQPPRARICDVRR